MDNVNSRFVTTDANAFGESNDDEIFVGNCHKWKRSEVKRLVLIRDHFINPALQVWKKLRYEHFCTSCKKIFEEHFVENLYVFSRVKNW